jgi:hypothetical protein
MVSWPDVTLKSFQRWTVLAALNHFRALMVAPNLRTAKRADQIPWPCGQQAAGADRSSLLLLRFFRAALAR